MWESFQTSERILESAQMLSSFLEIFEILLALRKLSILWEAVFSVF